MVEQVVDVDGRQVRAGSAADAGRRCVSDASPDGVAAVTYRWYVTEAGARGAMLTNPAPGPLTRRDPTDPTGQRRVEVRDPTSKVVLYDLDAVAAWNASRPGRGRRGTNDQAATADTLHRTPMRERLLVAAHRGQLRRAVGWRKGRPGHVMIGDEVLRSPRVAQMAGQLERLGLLGEPVGDLGRPRTVPITPAGIEVLTRWGVTSPDG